MKANAKSKATATHDALQKPRAKARHKAYETLWRNKFLMWNVKTLDDIIGSMEWAVAELSAMQEAGVVLVDGAADDYARLRTNDPMVAKRFRF